MSDAATAWNCRHCGRHYDKAVEPEREEATVGTLAMAGHIDQRFIPHIDCPQCGWCMGCPKMMPYEPDLTRTITWVPVGERLPDYGERVLVADAEAGIKPLVVGEAIRGFDDRWTATIPGGPSIHPFTHWAELPEGPA